MAESTISADWLDQDILDELAEGHSLEHVAGRHGLDPALAPAIAKALAG
jgi:hypothetical protein